MGSISRLTVRGVFTSRRRNVARVSLWMAPLVLMLVMLAGEARGQTTMMTTQLTERIGVPIDSSPLYTVDRFSRTDEEHSFFGDASELDKVDDEFTDAVSGDTPDGFIDARYADLDGDGPEDVGIVDWVVIQLRFVDKDDGQPLDFDPDDPVEGVITRTYTKTALLLSDGSVSDAEDPRGGILSFDDVEFDAEREDVYVVVDHRNHRAILSSQPLATGDDGLVLEYDFSTAAEQAAGGDQRESRTPGLYAMHAGDADGNNVVNIEDADRVLAAGLPRGYHNEDLNLDGDVNLEDVDIAEFRAGGTAFRP